MRDDPTFVEQIHRDLRTCAGSEPEEIRARARRRSQRKIVVATVVLALAGVSAVAVAGAEDVVATGSAEPPRPSPTRHEITTDALLQPADLPQQVDVQLSQSGLGEPVRLDRTCSSYCRTSQGRSDGLADVDPVPFADPVRARARCADPHPVGWSGHAGSSSG